MKDIDTLPNDYTRELYLKIGRNVKRIRTQKGISQLQLAHAIGHKSVTVISCAELCINNYHFNIEHLAKIAYVLEVEICDFFQ